MLDIAANLQAVREAIAKAQENSPYAAKEVKLVAVSKTKPAELINEAVRAGVTDLGENKVQELLEKYDQVKGSVNWHLIGHLQTNKVKHMLDKVCLLHSLDRLELADEIQKRAAGKNRVLPVLVQVNIAKEESKSGIDVAEVADFMIALQKYTNIKVQGLMTIGPVDAQGEQVRPVFRRLREIKAQVAQMGIPGIEMRYLSMGMSGDYPIAVAEGANIVRIGSAIFGTRNYY